MTNPGKLKYRDRLTLPLSSFVTALLFSLAIVPSTIGQQPGELDPTFGDGGRIIDGLGRAYHVAIQADGKIIVVEENYLSFPPVAIRYLPDGSLDPTFGDAGRAIIELPGPAVDVAIQADGKILVAVRDSDNSVNGYLVRLAPNGSLDTSFGTNGIVQTGETSITAVQPDGKILIVGIGSSVYRLNPDGSLDPTFQQNCGPHITSLVYPFTRTEGVVQPDAKVVTAFTAAFAITFPPTNVRFAAHRCDSNGLLDAGFGSGGTTITPIGAVAIVSSIAIQNDGKIVIAGSADSNFAVVRYNTNGTLDPGFGSGGITTTPIGSPQLDASARKTVATVMIQDDGKIVVAGTDHNDANNDFALVRYNPNGSLDTTFGGGDGIATVDFNNADDVVYGMALDRQGRAVLVGQSGAAFALARILLGPGFVTPHRARGDFDGDGKTDYAVYRPSDANWYENRSGGGIVVVNWGNSTDEVTPGDYDGDAKTDTAVFRASTGTWYIINSQNGSIVSYNWGQNGDIPVAADFDGDTKTDVAVFRPANFTWYVIRSTGGVSVIVWGAAGDLPVPGDYNGNGKADFAVYRPSNFTWYIQTDNGQILSYVWGAAGDRPVNADYDGDNKDDVAVFRPSTFTWHIIRSTGGISSTPWGANGDVPVPGDYNGDGSDDLGVYRNGTWFVQLTGGGIQSINWGVATDKPIPAEYIP